MFLSNTTSSEKRPRSQKVVCWIIWFSGFIFSHKYNFVQDFMQGWLKRTKPSTSNDPSQGLEEDDNTESNESIIASDESKLYVYMKMQSLHFNSFDITEYILFNFRLRSMTSWSQYIVRNWCYQSNAIGYRRSDRLQNWQCAI